MSESKKARVDERVIKRERDRHSTARPRSSVSFLRSSLIDHPRPSRQPHLNSASSSALALAPGEPSHHAARPQRHRRPLLQPVLLFLRPRPPRLVVVIVAHRKPVSLRFAGPTSLGRPDIWPRCTNVPQWCHGDENSGPFHRSAVLLFHPPCPGEWH